MPEKHRINEIELDAELVGPTPSSVTGKGASANAECVGEEDDDRKIRLPYFRLVTR